LNKRILVPLALLVLAALTLSACGGGGSSNEDKISKTIETAMTTSDPSNCTELATQRYVEQNTTEKGKAALKACEAEAEAGGEEAEAVSVSNVSVDGSKATAEAEFEGGPIGSQSVELALVEEDGEWKLDQIEGFAKYDGKALGEAFQQNFEEEPGELSPEQAKCISGKVAGLSQAEAEEVFFGGSAEKIIELAQSCGTP
jgi:hypothetical protein